MVEKGYVYALENKSFPGMIKIGQTKNLHKRLKQFNDTGIPTSNPTLLLFAYHLDNYTKAERLLHQVFTDKRDSFNKEWFKVSFNQVKAAFSLLSLSDDNQLVHPFEYNSKISKQVIEVHDRKIGTRPNRTFEYLNIPIGGKLTFKENPYLIARVTDKKNKVICPCCKTEQSLSRAAICCYDHTHKIPDVEKGRDRNGFAWFSYNGLLLDKIKPMVNAELV
ncbi:GIY-YIG nuclease family protein [Lactovum miscens]|uniref:Putative GIY-YIG superfamily endonuclease n=1 Tax=Lactovum miscens TaxID=190387 RepID=A0A841CB07_9LACT|nr:GIY-YIG nuclease family protein [Lactovum miscens]MBB5888742.1 putative GIY-YIG superfamily endonuclease [Lactovum miscens]